MGGGRGEGRGEWGEGVRGRGGGRRGGAGGDAERSRLMRIKVFKSLGVSVVGNQAYFFQNQS